MHVFASRSQAMHAKQEEQAQEVRALSAALTASDWGKVRRDFSESARHRVMTAAEQHHEAKRKGKSVRVADVHRHSQAKAPAEDMAQPSDGGSLSNLAAAQLFARPLEGGEPDTGEKRTSIEEMLQQRKALLDAGFDAEAEKVQQRLVQIRSTAERERIDLEQRLFKQRLASLEREQQERREGLARAQAVERTEAEAGWRDEIEALLEAQADEHQEFELTITVGGRGPNTLKGGCPPAAGADTRRRGGRLARHFARVPALKGTPTSLLCRAACRRARGRRVAASAAQASIQTVGAAAEHQRRAQAAAERPDAGKYCRG